ncbi:uncharacterized protein LTHEOB_5482 [Neofusicoccum parvum]|uniref:Uncharacterized protein LTHEOB_5482 n=1 Tax=Neofusicoccum parvum TaxID=310453 RepID=A0ACB5SJ79_9PEZI|nr:uncharacterized protein LTHEOB_5482 [Neofusicoccum parvum]
MSNGARSSACTALTNDPLPKILAFRRNMDSQTYSASIEEADIYDSFATMEPPIRFSFRAPSKRFFSAIVFSQLTLLSTVVALVLFIANAHTVTNDDRTGYVIWLVFSACGTFFFTLMAVIYWTQRRKLRFMQSKLKLMQLDAEAHGSQKRLETASSAPQLRAETDHRQSVLIQYPGAEETPDTDATASRNSGIPNSTIIGRRRRGTTNASSTAAGEGCELVHFQTHLSGASSSGTRNRDDGGDEATAAVISSPPPVYTSLRTHQRRQRESTTTRLWQDDPTMMDLYHGLNASAPSDDSHHHRLSALSLDHAGPIVPETTPPSPPSHRPTLTSSATANRSSTALPATAPPHHQPAVSGASALPSTTSSSPDYGIILPTFPLPPTHARFSHDHGHGPLGEGDVADWADGARTTTTTTTVLEPLAEGGAAERRRDSHVDVEEHDGEGEGEALGVRGGEAEVVVRAERGGEERRGGRGGDGGAAVVVVVEEVEQGVVPG